MKLNKEIEKEVQEKTGLSGDIDVVFSGYLVLALTEEDFKKMKFVETTAHDAVQQSGCKVSIVHHIIANAKSNDWDATFKHGCKFNRSILDVQDEFDLSFSTSVCYMWPEADDKIKRR